MAPRRFPSRLALLALLLAGAAGCLPKGLPGYSADGKRIALTLPAVKGEGRVLWTYDVEGKRARSHPMPDGWRLEAAEWVGNDVWVLCGAAKDRDEVTFAPFDLEGNRFRPGPVERARRWKFNFSPFFAGFEGRPALFVENAERPAGARPGVFRYDVLAASDLSKIATAEIPLAESIGQGWSTRRGTVESQGARAIAAMDLFDADGKKRATLASSEIAPAFAGGDPYPLYTRVAPDGAAVLLAFGTQDRAAPVPLEAPAAGAPAGGFSFGVFDAATGRLLWRGRGASLHGTPLVRKDEVWTLERSGDLDGPARRVRLARHAREPEAADGAAGRREAGREIDLGRGGLAAEFAPSPDGSKLLVAVGGERPRLLFLPLRADTEGKDVETVELNEEAPPAAPPAPGPAEGPPPASRPAAPIGTEAEAMAAFRRHWESGWSAGLEESKRKLVQGSIPEVREGKALRARKIPWREAADRVAGTLRADEQARAVLAGSLEALAREGECWEVSLDLGMASVVGYLDPKSGEVVLLWSVPEG